MIIHNYSYIYITFFWYDLRLPHFTARPSATCTALRKWNVFLYDIAQCWQRKEFFVSYHHQFLDHPGSSEASLPVTSVAFARASFATTCGREELLFDQRPWKVVGFVPSAFAALFAPLKVSNVGCSWVLSRNPIWNPWDVFGSFQESPYEIPYEAIWRHEECLMSEPLTLKKSFSFRDRSRLVSIRKPG